MLNFPNRCFWDSFERQAFRIAQAMATWDKGWERREAGKFVESWVVRTEPFFCVSAHGMVSNWSPCACACTKLFTFHTYQQHTEF